ncbi:response regulator [bacterium]|nr:response regulator [bacterium]
MSSSVPSASRGVSFGAWCRRICVPQALRTAISSRINSNPSPPISPGVVPVEGPAAPASARVYPSVVDVPFSATGGASAVVSPAAAPLVSSEAAESLKPEAAAASVPDAVAATAVVPADIAAPKQSWFPPEEKRIFAPVNFRDMRVAVADDDAACKRFWKRMLTRFDAKEVCVFSDGDEILSAAQAAHNEGNPFSLIILDLHMPKMNGDVALREMRGCGLLGRIVMATSEERIEAPHDGLLNKPFSISSIETMFDFLDIVYEKPGRTSRAASDEIIAGLSDQYRGLGLGEEGQVVHRALSVVRNARASLGSNSPCAAKMGKKTVDVSVTGSAEMAGAGGLGVVPVEKSVGVQARHLAAHVIARYQEAYAPKSGQTLNLVDRLADEAEAQLAAMAGGLPGMPESSATVSDQ